MDYKKTMEQYRLQIERTNQKIREYEALSIKPRQQSFQRSRLACISVVPHHLRVQDQQPWLPTLLPPERRLASEPNELTYSAVNPKSQVLSTQPHQPSEAYFTSKRNRAVLADSIIVRREGKYSPINSGSYASIDHAPPVKYSNITRYQDYLKQYEGIGKERVGQGGYESEHSKVLGWIMYKQAHEEKQREQTLLRFQEEAERKKKEKSAALKRDYGEKLKLPFHGWEARPEQNTVESTNKQEEPFLKNAVIQSQPHVSMQDSGVQTNIMDTPIRQPPRQRRAKSQLQPVQVESYIDRHLYSLRRKKQSTLIEGLKGSLPRKDPLNEISDLLSEVNYDLKYKREIHEINTKLEDMHRQLAEEKQLRNDVLQRIPRRG